MTARRQQDILYGYKDGMALVMDVYYPAREPNRAAVLQLISGAYRSDLATWREDFTEASDISGLLHAGFTVFAVGHSSSPRYRVDEILPDISRAVRFVRHHSDDFGIDPLRIGMKGISSGGLLTLVAAASPPLADPAAELPVDRESSAVQAVVVYSSPTDLLNVIKPGTDFLQFFRMSGQPVLPAFDFHTWDELTQRFERVIDGAPYLEVARQISPMTHLDSGAPPVLLLHSDSDPIVPLQQAESLAARLQELGVPGKLVTAQGRGHVWDLTGEEVKEVVAWFSRYLL
ncbi:alpha/beta hydrolase [Candidatus Latescibacterota bacterium]